MPSPRPTLTPWRVAWVFIGCATATALALDPDPLFQLFEVLLVQALLLLVAAGVWGVGWVWQRPAGGTAVLIIGMAVFQFVSIPVQSLRIDWEMRRAQTWCERYAPRVSEIESWEERQDWLDRHAEPAPPYALYLHGQCRRVSPYGFIGDNGWKFDVETRTWRDAGGW